jgi:gliding motility-associated-like protein
MKKIALFIFCFIVCSIQAQFSKTHYIPPLSGSESQPAQGQFMYISSPSLTPVNFTISSIGGGVVSGTVSRDAPFVYNIGFGLNTQLHIPRAQVNSILNNKGFIVEAEDQVYVGVRMTATPDHFQASGLVSKGLAALGTDFRIGAFVNTGIPGISNIHYTFVSVLATENNTVVNFSDIKPGVTLINSGGGNNIMPVILNRGQSITLAVEGPNNANRDGLIGARVQSDKPVAVNCGSFCGTNGNNPNNLDMGLDQIVPADRVGNEYIFVRGFGENVIERVLLVAHENNTQIFLNGDLITPAFIIDASQYVALDGSAFSFNNNLFVQSSKNIFAYQGVGGSSQANQEMYFVPPLSCQTPRIINNIPLLERIGPLSFTGNRGVNLVTKTGSTIDLIINGVDYSILTPPLGVLVQGPFPVTGTTEYVTYQITGITGNVSVFSSSQLYLSYFGSSGAATYGGYYSGFTFKPEVNFNRVDVTADNCIPNINLGINSLSPFDTYQWFFNDVEIPGANGPTHTPSQPGYYFLRAIIAECGTELQSDRIPVSACPSDMDNDGVNDNIDLDNDNDGLTNCEESFGNLPLNLSNQLSGVLSLETYTNSFTGSVTTTNNGNEAPVPFTGFTNGDFTTQTAPGPNSTVDYQMDFNIPVSLEIKYISENAASALFSSNTEYIISVPPDKTLTILNPDGQLLIDTNYDGIYENNVEEFSSFELRFRLSSGTALAAGSGTFKIRTYSTERLVIKHKNIQDFAANSSLNVIATCVPKDSDGDGIPDQIDWDSDNDGIPDFIEAQGNDFIAYEPIDENRDGISDVFGNGLTPFDNDNDGVPDYLDLDSDNDGIFDVYESGSGITNLTPNGRINGTSAQFGVNGLFNNLETTPDSGILNYTIADSNGDGVPNFRSLDSDGDGCFDVVEAGFIDPDGNGLLGTGTPTVNELGLVSGTGSGYSLPNQNYIIPAPIEITEQPQDEFVCLFQTVLFTLEATLSDQYQWQLSSDNGVNWSDLNNNDMYAGVETVTLQISGVLENMDGYLYRVILNRDGNSCDEVSEAARLTVYPLPLINPHFVLVQCDDDLDGISAVNLTQVNNFISNNFENETFNFFTTLEAAENNDSNFLINDPIAYVTSNTPVWVRVSNSNDCFSISEIKVFVSATQIPPGFLRTFAQCDDFIDVANDDRDGIATFDFSIVTADLTSIIPPGTPFSIQYYRSLEEALAETDAEGNSLAVDPSNYRNEGFPGFQQIWVRVESELDNSCFGLGPYVELTVEALPIANEVPEYKSCDDDFDGLFPFDTSLINAQLLDGQNPSDINIAFTTSDGTVYNNALPNPFLTSTQTVIATLTNATTNAPDGPCFEETIITFTVDVRPQAFTVNVPAACDNDGIEDGLFAFDTTTIENQLLNGQTGMVVTYFDQNNTPLPSPLPNPMESGNQIITAVVTNPLNTTCPATTTIEFMVYPLPQLDDDYSEIICFGLDEVTIDAGLLQGNISDFTYQWLRNDIPIDNAVAYQITVDENGEYTVEVTSPEGCVQTRTIEVIYSQAAILEDFIVTDLSDDNSITINVSGYGIYEYSIGYLEGPYQSSNTFVNVPAGAYEIFINDTQGCGVVSTTVYVLGIPKFFTPNGDNFNDTWNIQGVNPAVNANSRILIFDRYGKLMNQISPQGIGWDGTYQGQPLPTDDYWYTIEFGDGRSAKGHFTLKR